MLAAVSWLCMILYKQVGILDDDIEELRDINEKLLEQINILSSEYDVNDELQSGTF